MWFLFAIRAGIVVAAAISFVVVTLFYPRIRMEWYEHGFRRIRGNRVQTILYQQLGQLTYYAVHQYLQQIKRTYVCTRYTLVLLPDPDAGIPVISTWKNSK